MKKNATFTKVILCLTVMSLLSISNILNAQDTEKPEKFDWLNISGFIANSVKYDTRQTVYAREGELLLYPKPVELDENGVDKNDFGRLNMFNLHSRMAFSMTGKDVNGFKISAKLEFDFFGVTNDNPAVARIRHAFVKVSKDQYGFIFGQTWHPTFFVDCYPEVIAWGAAVPTQPFSRAPQVRFFYTPSKELEVSLSALSQRDFSNHGPNGASGDYLRNSGIPEMQFSIVSRLNNGISMGAGVGYKTIVPRLLTDSLIAEKESISSYNLSGFLKYKNDNFYIKAHGIYGENLSNLLLIGGYGVESIDVATDARTYENYRSIAFWGETEYKVNNFGFGFFLGYVVAPDNKNRSAINYGLGTNIESLIRWSPRVVYKNGNLKFGLELATTTANYLDQTLNGTLVAAHAATDYRYIFTTQFYF